MAQVAGRRLSIRRLSVRCEPEQEMITCDMLLPALPGEGVKVQWAGDTSEVTLILLIQLGRSVAINTVSGYRYVGDVMDGLTYDISACLLTLIGCETDLQCSSYTMKKNQRT